MSIIHRIRSKYSEPYRIRNGWGLTPVRNVRELKALVAFCEEELKDRKHMKLNKQRRNIYSAVVKMYRLIDADKVPLKGMYFDGRRYFNIYDLIEQYIAWFWS